MVVLSRFRSVHRLGLLLPVLVLGSIAAPGLADDQDVQVEYQLLATSKTSTMQEELNAAAKEGFRFSAVMGGETLGGSEVVVVMTRRPDQPGEELREYLLLATSKTSTMQKELAQAASEGYEYRGQSVFSTTFGGDEVVLILERSAAQSTSRWEYLLLGTKKTGTMQKELTEAGRDGFELVGLTVASTTFGGNELVAILRRPAPAR